MKRVKIVICEILVFLVIVSFSFFSSGYFMSEYAAPAYPNGDTIVCVTATGTKYHLQTCSYLKSSSFETSLEEAVSDSFSPCSRCKPPPLITEEDYRQKKEEQPTVLYILIIPITSVPLTFVYFLVIAKLNDLFRFMNNFHESFFFLMPVSIFIVICIQGFRILLIW